MPGHSDRDALLKDFISAARALVGEGLSGLNPEKAVLADQAMRRGADVVLIHAISSGAVICALSLPSGDATEIFRIKTPEVSH
jgi:hypothetical protein